MHVFNDTCNDLVYTFTGVLGSDVPCNLEVCPSFANFRFTNWDSSDQVSITFHDLGCYVICYFPALKV